MIVHTPPLTLHHTSPLKTTPHREPCDDDVSDCGAVNPPHAKKNVTKVTIETPPTTAEEPRGPVIHPTRPVFEPRPRPVEKVGWAGVLEERATREGERGIGRRRVLNLESSWCQQLATSIRWGTKAIG